MICSGATLRAEQTKKQVDLITAEELKTKLAARDPVTIIDVRNTNSLGESNDKIPGSIHIKLRRLRSRLKFAPLKDVPKDREIIITYCACPGDETSTRAAEVLVEAGFTRVRALKAGWRGWLQLGGSIEESRR
jgi:rhodanese-related sulfurtransferase